MDLIILGDFPEFLFTFEHTRTKNIIQSLREKGTATDV